MKIMEVSLDGKRWYLAKSLGNRLSDPDELDLWRVATLLSGQTMAVKFWREIRDM